MGMGSWGCQEPLEGGLDCRYHEWVGGHDHLWWGQQLPAALKWLLTPP